MPIRNVHRTVGTILSNRIVKRHGGAGLPDGTIELTFRGSAGQSFGGLSAPRRDAASSMGDANDYWARGCPAGGSSCKPPPGSPFAPEENMIVGNTCCTAPPPARCSSTAWPASGSPSATAAPWPSSKGVGDHGCEYMTGGTVVVLGRTGRNFAAGMSGGIAYVLDEQQLFDTPVQPGNGRSGAGLSEPEDLDVAPRPDPPALPVDGQRAGQADPRPLATRCRASSSKSCRSIIARPWSGSASANRRQAARPTKPLATEEVFR